jgi:sugar phosphate isomerase/epimerase
MMLAMSNIAWDPSERLEAYDALAVSGVPGLEIAPGLFFHAADDPFVPNETAARTALAEIAAAGLSLVSMQSLLFGVEGAALFGDADEQTAFMRGMCRAIDLAGRFGVGNLVFGSPGMRRVPEGMPMANAMARAVERFQTLGDRAAAAGTIISLEPNPAAYGTNFLNRLDEAEQLASLTAHPAVMVNLDLGAMHMNGDYAAVIGHVAGNVSRIGHVHVSEPQLAPAPGDAAVLGPVLQALNVAGYGRAISIEMRRPAGGIDDVKSALARLVAAVDARTAARGG